MLEMMRNSVIGFMLNELTEPCGHVLSEIGFHFFK